MHISRKNRVCEMCRKTIGIGDTYSIETGKYDESFFKEYCIPNASMYLTVIAEIQMMKNSITMQSQIGGVSITATAIASITINLVSRIRHVPHFASTEMLMENVKRMIRVIK